MPSIIGVIDESPFDFRTWSGSSKYFFEQLRHNGALVEAHGAESAGLTKRIHQICSFSPNLAKWKFKYHLNTKLFAHMSHLAKDKISMCENEFDVILQVGAWYDLIDSTVLNVSYHDGNLATLLSSPFGYPLISRRLIDKALSFERNLYRRMDLICPMSRWLGDSFIRDFGVEPEKVVPVGAGINLPYIKNSEHRSYQSKTLLMVGKDFRRKGGEVLLRAFSKVRKSVPDARLRLIGPQLEDLPDGVECVGYVSKESDIGLNKLLDEYLNAQVFVIPSLYEPFGISFVEAMAHRVPCVGTNICAMPEIIEQEKTGYVVSPGDADSLAARLIELLESESMCKEFGEAGFQRYQENYTWEIVVKRLIEAIETRQSS